MFPFPPDGAGSHPAPSLFLRRSDLADLPPLDLPDGYGLLTATDADADAMAEMLVGAFLEMVWTADKVRGSLLNDTSVKATFVIDREGIPVVTASARIVPDAYPGSGYVHWVGTAPGHRGKRLGLLASLATLHEFARDMPVTSNRAGRWAFWCFPIFLSVEVDIGNHLHLVQTQKRRCFRCQRQQQIECSTAV